MEIDLAEKGGTKNAEFNLIIQICAGSIQASKQGELTISLNQSLYI